MQIITTREFRANQKKYFELAEKETIFVSRRNAAPIVVYAATEEDFPSREELEAIPKMRITCIYFLTAKKIKYAKEPPPATHLKVET